MLRLSQSSSGKIKDEPCRALSVPILTKLPNERTSADDDSVRVSDSIEDVGQTLQIKSLLCETNTEPSSTPVPAYTSALDARLMLSTVRLMG